MTNSYTLFADHQRLSTGRLDQVAVAFAAAFAASSARAAGGDHAPRLLVFEDATGRQVDVDTRGTDAEIAARYAPAEPAAPTDTSGTTDSEVPARGPGRPRLGVVAREVTLLPHHWEWLGAQPGGASVTLRKLVEQARKTGAAAERTRLAREASYRFLHAIGGNLPDYEEVTRALFAGDTPRMRSLMSQWPQDIREYALALSQPVLA